MSNGAQTGSEIVSLAYNAEAIEAAITAEVSVIPILNVIMFALDILELAGIIPNPISLLIQAFTGRPREQASLEQAGRLMNARNPAARQAGIMLERMVKEWGIVTSQSGSGRTILDSWAQLFVNNLTAQGVSLDRARQILVHATSEAAQTGLPLEPELQQPLPPQLVFNAEQSTFDYLTAQYKIGIQRGLTIDNALNFAEGQMFKNIGLRHLFKLQIGTYIPPQPPPQTVIPGQGGSCPGDYSLDPSTSMCVLNPGQGGNGGGGGGGGNVGPDQDGDEITNELCAQMNSCTDRLISALQGASPTAPPVDDACCQNVVDALGNVVTSLTSIAAAAGGLASSMGTPVDLSGIVGELDRLVNAIGALAPSSSIDFSPVVTALDNISNAISAGGGADTSSIVDQLKIANQLRDIPHEIIQEFLSDGVLPPEYSSILQGTPADWVHAALRAAAMFSPIIGFVEHILGDDKDFSAAIRKDREGAKAVIGKIMALGRDLGGLPPEASTDTIKTLFTKFFTVSEATLGPLVEPVVDAIVAKLSGTGTPALGAYPVNPDGPIADVTGAALGAAVGGWLAAYAGIDEGEPLAKMVEFMSGAIGFEELRDVKIGPLIRNGIGQVAEMKAREAFQQNIPGAGTAYALVARGLLDAGTADALAGWNGLHTSLRPATAAAAYSGLNPRMLLRLVSSGLYSQGDIIDEMNFAGLRPASQQRFTRAMPWLATETERKQLESTLEKAHIAGLIGDADLAQDIDGLDQNTDRNSLILQRANLEKRIAYAKEIEIGYRQEFMQGIFNEAQYRSILQGLGLQDDWINARVAADEAHLTANLTRQAAAEERALIRATDAQERRAAVKNFTTGNIDAVALTAALVLTGLTPAQAAAWVDLAVLQKAGSLRWIFGLQKSPSDAALLRARVTALSDQRKRQQISDAQLLSDLQALGISASYANAIRASVDAMITPKADAVTIPVETK